MAWPLHLAGTMRRIALLVPVLVCSCSPAAPEPVGSSSEAYTTQCPGSTVEGVDVSAFQSPINWGSVVAAGRHFAFIKATQGNYYISPNFSAQYAGAKAAGVFRSAYHFFDPTVDGVTQANYFLSVASIQPDDLPPMLDVECPDGDNACLGWSGGTGWAPSATIVSRALDWLSTVATKTGKKPIVYSFPAYFPDLGTADNGLAAYPLFIATLSSCASVPPPWSSAKFWQYSWSGWVNGIPALVDLDRFFGTMTDLQNFANACHVAGASCTTASDCCASAKYCDGAHVCAACLNPGDACKTDADCCGLSVCTSGGTCSSNPLPAQTTGNRWITAVNWPGTGEAEVFVRGTDGTLVHIDDSAGTWSAPASFGQPVACGSAASFWLKNTSTRVGFPEVFSPGPSGAPALDDAYDPTTKAWGAPVTFAGGGLDTFVSLPWPDGHVEVFAHAKDGSISHRYWDLASSTWGDWSSMGGSLTSTPTAIIRPDNQAELYGIDAQGLVWHDESGPFPGGWSGWRLLYDATGDAGAPVPLASRPVPVRTPAGGLSIFATTTKGDLVTATHTTAWSALTTIATGVTGEPSAVISSGNPEVFVRDTKGAVSHTWPITSGWQPLTPLLTQTSSVDPWAWQWMDGSVEVFAAQENGHGAASLSHITRDSNGTWSTWQSLGGAIDVCDASSFPPSSDGGTTPPTPPNADNGCACHATPSGGGQTPAIVVLASLVVVVIRRRKR